MMTRFALMTILLSTMVALHQVQGAVVTVTNQAQFLSALSSPAPGTTIQINSPISAPLVFQYSSGITLTGATDVTIISSPAGTTLDCSGFNERCFEIHKASRLSITGLSVSNFLEAGFFVSDSHGVNIVSGRVSGGREGALTAAPIYVADSQQVQLLSLRIDSNTYLSTPAAGIQMVDCQSCVITGCQINNNRATTGTALLLADSSCFIDSLDMADNIAVDAPMLIYRSDVFVQNSNFHDNQSPIITLGSLDYSNVTFLACSFFNNVGSAGPGLFGAQNARVNFDCCSFRNNACPGCESALISIRGSSPDIVPPGFACLGGRLYIDNQPQNASCSFSPGFNATVDVRTSVFIGTNTGVPAIFLLERAFLRATGFQLQNPVALSIQGGSAVNFDSSSRISGAIQCSGAGNNQYSPGNCGSSACGCGTTAQGNIATTFTCTIPTSTATATFTTPSGTTTLPTVTSPNGTVVINTTAGPIIVVGPPGTSVGPSNASAQNETVVSPIINVTINGTGGPVPPVDISLPVTDLDPDKNYCLAYFDEEENKWKCVDECLHYNKSGERYIATGSTPHLTSFAILLGGGGCGGLTTWYQIATIVSLGTAALIILLIILLFCYVAPFQTFIIGEEAQRVAKLRKHMNTLSAEDLEAALPEAAQEPEPEQPL